MQPQYASAGNAEEKSPAGANPVGLYRRPATKDSPPLFAGVLDPAGGDAVVRQGFELYQEGREAAMLSEDEIKKLEDIPTKSGGAK